MVYYRRWSLVCAERRLEIGDDVPKLFQEDANFDPIGSLHRVQRDIWLLAHHLRVFCIERQCKSKGSELEALNAE